MDQRFDRMIFFCIFKTISNLYCIFRLKIQGKVVDVSDGDTLRIVHRTSLFQSASRPKKLTTDTIQIRLCAIDAPETAKFGQDGQKHAEQSKENLSVRIFEKRARVTSVTTYSQNDI
jgi:endonuclease YncB( thermonuclease family)